MVWQRSGLQRLFMSLVGKITWFSFFLAYFMSVVLKSLEITMVTYAIFGVLIALIFVQSQKGKLAPAAETNTSNASFDEDDYDDGF